ncbi:membrane traffic protein [Lithospermum erythrorhizon]|uniref:Membrane traffic protein n=1 Tax=Lithospermum erythrorhizon TaxID=34254 RepID=A0AAV3PB35_LITER
MDSQPSPRSGGRLENNTSQSLSSILNNPHTSKSAYSVPPDFSPLPNPPYPYPIPDLDFTQYISTISDSFSRFHDIQNHEKSSSSTSTQLDDGTSISLGDSLVACLREVPSLFFKEDFRLEEGSIFRSACPFRTPSENSALQERLSHYLDVVELHLVKEISLRSGSFFEAQGQLVDLNSNIVQGCGRIRELKETIRLLDSGLVGTANNVHQLSKNRIDFILLHKKLRLILYVNQALSALTLLVTSADCAGALDIIDDLQHLLAGDELTGLHCFRHLRDHVVASTDSINSILSAEFLRASTHDADDVDVSLVLKLKEGETVAQKIDEVKMDEDDIISFRDRLLPLVIGLLRTAKLPVVLRVYRDTLTTDMKIAIKGTVEGLLPVLVVQPMESEFIAGERTTESDGGGSSLATKLRSLSAENFVHLLSAVFYVVRTHLVQASEVKKAIEWLLSNPDGHYAADSVAAALTLGAVSAEIASGASQQNSFSPTLQNSATRLHSGQGRLNESTSPSNLSRNLRADVLRENAEAVFSGCDAAHGRWAKLLGVRAAIHPKLRLQEFLSIYSITQEFICVTEKVGGRLGYSIRGTLQSQAKAFVDYQHGSRMAKMRALLDQENWSEVDVPDEFQTIVASHFSPEASDAEIDASGHVTAESEAISTTGSSPSTENGLLNSLQVTEQNGQATKNYDNAANTIDSSMGGSSVRNNQELDNSLAQQGDTTSVKERAKNSMRTLSFRGNAYHMVNCGLILVKMLSEYIDMNNCLPALSSEVVHRVVEILKFFNTRTCQLVLGAGAMQVLTEARNFICPSNLWLRLWTLLVCIICILVVAGSDLSKITLQVSGLRSITSKNLALASQVVSFIYAIIPEIRRALFLKVPETRRELLSLEIDRVAQDYGIHRDEIHSKLVQIMRERLMVHLRGLPQLVESWNRPEEADMQPSQFARSLTKEVNFLQRVLSRTLHEIDVQAIFRQVATIFHSQIAEAFSHLEISTPQANDRLQHDVQHILGCIRSLPSDNPGQSNPPNFGQLDELLAQRFGTKDG